MKESVRTSEAGSAEGRLSTSSLDSIHLADSPESSQDAAKNTREKGSDELSHVSTHISIGLDTPLEASSSAQEIPDEVYDRLSPKRKMIIVALLSFCSFLAPISSTSVLAATPEVAAEYGTSGSIVNLSNAMYMLWMGISPLFWGPFSQVYGRRPVGNSLR
jgi:hypothetical protein